MVVCAVSGCNSNSRLGKQRIKFFHFPKETEIRLQWLKRCDVKEYINLKNARICSEHFSDKDWRLQDVLLKIPFEKRRLKPGAIPMRKLPKKVRQWEEAGDEVETNNYSTLNKKIVDNADTNPMLNICVEDEEEKSTNDPLALSENDDEELVIEELETENELIKSNVQDMCYQNQKRNESRQNWLGIEKLKKRKRREISHDSEVISDDGSILNGEDEKIAIKLKPNSRKDVAIPREKYITSTNIPKIKNEKTDKNFKEYRELLEKSLQEQISQKRKRPDNSCITAATQTEVDLECSRELHIMELEKKCKLLERRIRKMTESKAKLKKVNENLRQIFTKSQIRKILDSSRKDLWSLDDISSAISLYSVGSRAYRYMYKRNYPIPSPSVLRKCAFKINAEPGVSKSALNILSQNNLSNTDKLCILCFDKINIRVSKDDNNSKIGPTKFVLVAVVSGLLNQWKHLVFFNYDIDMNATILNDILGKLQNIEYTVVAVVSDIDSRNQVLWDELGVECAKPWFEHPSDKHKKVFVFVDVFNLLNSLRNHFINYGFQLRDGKIDVNIVRTVLKVDTNIKKNCSITEKHLSNVECDTEQNVRYAIELFSDLVSTSMRRNIVNENHSHKCNQCADFIEMVHEWFETFTTKAPAIDDRACRQAFGLAFEEQSYIISTMSDTILHLNMNDSSGLLPFQSGILMSNESLLGLYIYLHEFYDISYFTTYYLSRYSLASLFKSLFTKTSPNNLPSDSEFRYWLKSYLLCEGGTLTEFKTNL